MSEWKDGDEAMVTLYRVHGHLAEVECGDCLRTVHVECLHPLPADPHQALKDAVIATAGEVRTTAPLTDGRLRAIIKMFYAIDRLEDKMKEAKPDLVMTLFETVMAGTSPSKNKNICADVFHPSNRSCLQNHPECHCRRHIARGLAAVDAARGAK